MSKKKPRKPRSLIIEAPKLKSTPGITHADHKRRNIPRGKARPIGGTARLTCHLCTCERIWISRKPWCA